jgi:hypothetical protein
MLQNHADNLSQASPAISLGLELRSTLCGQPIKLCLASRLARAPFGDEKLLVFEPMKGRVERALLDLQSFFRDLLNALRNRIAVDWPERNDAEDQQVQRTLGEIEFGWSRHAYDFYIYMYDL